MPLSSAQLAVLLLCVLLRTNSNTLPVYAPGSPTSNILFPKQHVCREISEATRFLCDVSVLRIHLNPEKQVFLIIKLKFENSRLLSSISLLQCDVIQSSLYFWHHYSQPIEVSFCLPSDSRPCSYCVSSSRCTEDISQAVVSVYFFIAPKY
jgi:hypothetical protein